MAVIFDVDGTLAETERDGHRRAFNAALRELGLPYRWGVEEYGELLAITGGRRRLEAYLLGRGHTDDAESLAAALHQVKTERFVEWVSRGEVRARPGAHDLLRRLARDGCRLAVATTGSRAWVDHLLARLFPDIPFAAVVTGNDVDQLKPHPEAYRTALARLGLGPEQALAVEDSPPGVQSALAAGLACVAVTSTYTTGLPFPPQTSAVVSSFAAAEIHLHRLLSLLSRDAHPAQH